MKHLLLLFLLIPGFQGQAQNDTLRPKKDLADTAFSVMGKEFVLVESDSVYKAKYRWYMAWIYRAYPYVKVAKQVVEQCEADLALIESKKQSKKYINQELEELKDRFTNGIMTMTQGEGKCLVKLIYRDLGMTAYEIAYKYLGSTRAMMWQSVSRLGGANLKLKYDPLKGDDVIMEEIVRKIERKEIWVPSEPEKILSRRQYTKDRKERIKVYQAEQKKKKQQSTNTGVSSR